MASVAETKFYRTSLIIGIVVGAGGILSIALLATSIYLFYRIYRLRKHSDVRITLPSHAQDVQTSTRRSARTITSEPIASDTDVIQFFQTTRRRSISSHVDRSV